MIRVILSLMLFSLSLTVAGVIRFATLNMQDPEQKQRFDFMAITILNWMAIVALLLAITGMMLDKLY